MNIALFVIYVLGVAALFALTAPVFDVKKYGGEQYKVIVLNIVWPLALCGLGIMNTYKVIKESYTKKKK